MIDTGEGKGHFQFPSKSRLLALCLLSPLPSFFSLFCFLSIHLILIDHLLGRQGMRNSSSVSLELKLQENYMAESIRALDPQYPGSDPD